jgi:hypothetical protein
MPMGTFAAERILANGLKGFHIFFFLPWPRLTPLPTTHTFEVVYANTLSLCLAFEYKYLKRVVSNPVTSFNNYSFTVIYFVIYRHIFLF